MFAIDLDTPLTREQIDSIVDPIAKKIVDRRLEVPAVLLLETHKPLSFVASQATLVAMPMLGPLVGAQRMADFSKILADRANVELLIARIEEMAATRDGSEGADVTTEG